MSAGLKQLSSKEPLAGTDFKGSVSRAVSDLAFWFSLSEGSTSYVRILPRQNDLVV